MIQFARYFATQKWAHGVAPRGSEKGIVARQSLGSYSIVRVHGHLRGETLGSFEEVSARAVLDGQDVIADLAGVTAIGADAVATLMNFSNTARGNGGIVTVVGVRPHLAKLLDPESSSPSLPRQDAAAPAFQAQFNVRLSGESVICQLTGELSSESARVVSELCRQLTNSVKDVTIDLDSLTDRSRASLAPFCRKGGVLSMQGMNTA